MSIYHCGLMMLLAIGRSPPSDHADSLPPTKVQSRPIPVSRLPPTAALPCRSGTMHVSLTGYVATRYDCILFTLLLSYSSLRVRVRFFDAVAVLFRSNMHPAFYPTLT